MAAKRRRRAKKKNPAKKRRHKRAAASPVKRRRARRANPKRRHKRRNPSRTHARRVRRANPKRRHKRRHAAANPTHRRRARRNPSRRHHKRRSRRNPGMPTWALAALAAGAGLVTYAIGQAGSFSLTQRLDPSRATLDRNRYIGFGVLTAAGLAIAAFVKGETAAMLGAGVAAGGLMGLGGTELSLAIGKVTDLTTAPAVLAQPPAATVKGLRGVYDDPAFGAVYGAGAGRQQLGAVYAPNAGAQRFGRLGTVYASGEDDGLGAVYGSGGSQNIGTLYQSYDDDGDGLNDVTGYAFGG